MAEGLSVQKGQIVVRLKGQSMCLEHKGTPLNFYCEKCTELVCVKCIVSSHKAHAICEISELNSQNTLDVQHFIENAENQDLLQLDQYIQSTGTRLEENARNFERLSTELKSQANELKQEIDLYVAKTLSLYHQMEQENAQLLTKYQHDLEKYNKELRKQVEDYKGILQQGSDIELYDAAFESKSHVPRLPVKPTLQTASFTPNKNPQSYLEKAIGTLTSSGQGQTYTDHYRSAGSSTDQGHSSSQQRLETKTGKSSVSPSQYRLLSATEEVGGFTSPYDITTICPTANGTAWTSGCLDNTVTLLDSRGGELQKIQLHTAITDMSLSPTDRLWTCQSSDNSIMELVSGKLTPRFTTKEEPLCTCITDSDHVIVGMTGHVTKFTPGGETVHTTRGKLSVCTPYRIAECRVTHNVAVVDRDAKVDGGEDKPHVIIMNKDFHTLVRYRGDVPSTHQSAGTQPKPFSPLSLGFDSVGNLVIGDCTNGRILLISGGGQFLRILHTDKVWPWAVGVDRENVVWAAFIDQKVRFLKYSSG